MKATITLKSKAPQPPTVHPDSPKPLISLEQQRAAYAWQCVQGCTREYTTLAKAVPALIMTNGLMQTLAYYQGKGKDHHLVLSKQLCEWLKKRYPTSFTSSDYPAIMQSLFATSDSQLYRQVTEETLALLRWIRQFAATVNRG